jgi:hypothetical protein
MDDAPEPKMHEEAREANGCVTRSENDEQWHALLVALGQLQAGAPEHAKALESVRLAAPDAGRRGVPK